MPAVKIRQDEMKIVQEAADRVARRSNSRFVLDTHRVKVTDIESDAGNGNSDAQEGEETKPALNFD
jgi:hypothetical protein